MKKRLFKTINRVKLIEMVRLKILMLTLLFLSTIVPTGLTAQNVVDIDCSDLVRGDGSYSRLEQYHHGYASEDYINNKYNEWGVKILRSFVFRDIFINKAGEPSIDYDDLLTKKAKWQINAIYNAHDQTESLMIPWFHTMNGMGEGVNFDYAKYDDICKRLLLAMKKRFRKLDYVEVRNEPTPFEGGPFKGTSKYGQDRKDVFNRLYHGLADAVQYVNDIVSNGERVKIGGPSNIAFYSQWIDSTIDYAEANNLPLDVIMWHDYRNTSTYETSLEHVKYVQDKMQQAGFTDYEMMLTEYGRTGNTGDIREYADVPAEVFSKVTVHNLDLAAGYAYAGVDGSMPWLHQWNGNWSMNMFGYKFMENKQGNFYSNGWMEYNCVSGSLDNDFTLWCERTPDGSATLVGEIEFIDKDGNVLKPTVNASGSALVDGNIATIFQGNPNIKFGKTKLSLKFPSNRDIAKVRVYWPGTGENRITIDHTIGELKYNVLGDFPIYPQGHFMNMSAMLKEKLLNTNFTGENIRSLATIGDDGISVMVWNRNETQNASGNVQLTNIPAGMGATLKGIRYLTDQETANYGYDPENYAMTPSTMADITIGSNRTAQINVDLKPLAIALLTFDGDGNLGINDNRNNLPEYCYPNPVKNILNIPSSILSDGKITQYSIFDMAGNEIKIGNINRNRQINCNTLKAGVYIIKIYMAKNKVKRQVFVKN
jgi:hypothetical protein